VTALLIIVSLLIGFVFWSVVTGFVLYWLAPMAGWKTREQRLYWRSFGFNWGWFSPVLLLIYWLCDVIGYRVLGRGSIRKSNIRPHWVEADDSEQTAALPHST
jgi:hypothetical protein